MAVAVDNILVLIALLCPVGADMWKDKVHLSCDSTGMRVELSGGPGGVPFKGLMWIEGSEDPACAVRGTGKGPTIMYIPYEACNTHKASNSLYVNRVSLKERAGLVSSRDSVIEVVCRLKSGHVRVNSEKTIFSIITDGVMDISRRVSTPDIVQPHPQDLVASDHAVNRKAESAQPNVKLLRDNISGKHRLMVNLQLPKTTSVNLTSVLSCTLLQDNVVISTLEKRYPKRAFHRLRPSSNNVSNK
ncbi:uncharacterized protein LOC111263738 isoform X3 [Varroa jacobsoni]|uniref:uncharacterized protein LOC111263738 isoform X3 n=1 Tax=Varroa jacobsoni TaxID=62625 RepID=UPI000BF36E1F|nr:uncharacterized protein LOC111263738 isoform X3 [Varroa jacobsoni]